MNKSDLKNGMVVELSSGAINLVLQDNRCEGLVLVNPVNDRWLYLEKYNDDLTYSQRDSDDIYDNDIYKIFESYTKYMWDSDKGLLWERDETDWSKIPFGTKVKCWNNIEDRNAYEGKFLGYEDNHNGVKYLVFVSVGKVTSWKYCKLVEEPKEEITLENIFEDLGVYCGKYHDSYDKCTNVCDECKIRFIINNYNVTRK